MGFVKEKLRPVENAASGLKGSGGDCETTTASPLPALQIVPAFAGGEAAAAGVSRHLCHRPNNAVTRSNPCVTLEAYVLRPICRVIPRTSAAKYNCNSLESHIRGVARQTCA